MNRNTISTRFYEVFRNHENEVAEETIHIKGYLTQTKLADALKSLVDSDWIGNELKVPGSRRRWDMALRIKSTVWIVEYDGDEHYRNALKVKIDAEKDESARSIGIPSPASRSGFSWIPLLWISISV